MNPILENTPEQTSIEETPTMEPTPLTETLTETLAEHIAQAVAQAVAPLQKQIDRYQSQQLQQTRTLALKDALTLCQDPTFTQQTLKDFALMQFPSQEDFEHFLSEKQADILLANQALSHRELASQTPPLQPHKDNPTLSKEVALYLQAQKQPEIFSGKKLL